VLAALGAAGVCLTAFLAGSSPRAQTPADLQDTRHNLSATGPGPIQALTETRICIFCHTPHNATPLSPLWNKELEPQAYTMYTSATMKAGPLGQPTGATKLCLSCHDGTIAMGAVVNPSGGITMSGGGTLTPGSLSDFGLDLSDHHPVSFSYQTALPNAELVTSPPADLTYGAADEVHCTTCHDPHKDVHGKFLVKSNRYSALCTSCHQMTGWPASAHATSTASVAGLLPRPPKTWPAWPTLAEWGCETCHTPHFAPTGEQLLNFTTAPPDPFTCTTAGCHASEPAAPHAAALPGGAIPAAAAGYSPTTDIAGQTRKISAHREPPGSAAASLGGVGRGARSGVRSAGCADCHNPHLVTGLAAEPPFASGLLRGVSGIDRNGAAVKSATYEYEVCFKCHADSTPDLDYVPRVIASTNKRQAFDTSNPSYHPVVGMGKNLSVPSIPSSFHPSMSPAQMMYCTDCHADDEGGSRGPHGSSYAPILKQRYETADFTPESYESYALCYQCHDRSSILRDDSFRRAMPAATASGGGHSGHLSAGIPCSACHDPHGVPALASASTGSHSHLINFDTRLVQPLPGGGVPVFTDTGFFSGSCTLSCHGVNHDNASYP
jgi:predicted CXXCH cytochrome family protein